jgi:hypothetical protein
VPTLSYVLYSIGNLSLTVAIGIAASVSYGIYVGIAFAAVIVWLCFVCLMRLQGNLNKACHVVHGWAKGSNKERFDMTEPLSDIHERAKKAAESSSPDASDRGSLMVVKKASVF